MLYIFVFGVSLLLVLALTPFFIKFAFKKNFLDYPDPRKIHSHPTPLLGGASVFLGFLGGVLLSFFYGMHWSYEFSGVLLGGVIVLGLGLWDDKFGMRPGIKFFGQIVAAFIFLLVSQSFGKLNFGLLGDLLFFLWMVGLMNAFNFLDNMDGLCSGISVLAAAAFAVIFILTGQVSLGIICLALIGALSGFLLYNFPPAKIFLGDAGSMFNGFILSALGVLFAKRNSSFNQLLVPMLVLSYPIFDISLVTFTRAREGRKIYKGGKDHSSLRLMNLGFHAKKTLGSIYLISLGLGITGLLIFFFFESSWKLIIVVCAGLLLAILGAHLHRNLVRAGEKLFLILLDSIAVNLAFLFFYWLRFESGLFSTLIVIPLSEYLVPAIWVTLYWLVLFAFLGLYELRSQLPMKEEWKKIIKGVVLGIIIFSVLSIKFISLRFVLLYSLSLILLLLFFRTVFILWERALFTRGIGLRKTLILGTGEDALKLKNSLNTESNPGFKVTGFVSENREYPADLKVLGFLEDMDETLKKTKAEVVILALGQDYGDSVAQVLSNFEQTEVDLVVSEEQSRVFNGLKKVKFYKGPYSKIYPTQLRTWESDMKRILDFLFSLFLIMLTSPIWLLVSFLISLNYPGGILLKKNFLGKGGKLFQFYTFNSGPTDSQNELGKFLKSSKIEKLPVLLNVLKGEMSLVGPQPEEERSNSYSSELPDYYKRVDLKPGIFSLCQGRKETLAFSENMTRRKVEEGLLYAEKVSLWFDFKIILNQIFGLFSRRQDV
ncbi:MAG: sugar transferase [candidate division Zixibacteria bacterium]|nr:sugar transferase [candidate division Zixibacteria bacterium]